MPRVPRKEVKGSKYLIYPDVAIAQAAQMVKSKKLSIRKASIQYGVPQSTISDKLRVKHPQKPRKPTALSIEEENYLASGLLRCAEWGFPLTVKDLGLVVQSYVSLLGKPILFVSDEPGRHWVRSF